MKKSAAEGIVLAEAQVQALERRKHDDGACGEMETHHPGYPGGQDTFYVGPIGAWAAVTSKPLWTPIPNGLPPSFTGPGRR